MSKFLTALLTLGLACSAQTARAEVKTKEIEYKQAGTVLQGFLAWDDAAKGKRPGLLVIHEWWGHNQHARNQALRAAKSGYVAFALDMYGKGKLATHPEDAQAMMGQLSKTPDIARARFDAALAVLKADPHVDITKIGALGYCMGGGIALSMARAGEDLAAISAFHPGIQPPDAPAKKGTIKPRILLNIGADDPFVPPAAIENLEKEMAAAGAQLKIIRYPGAKHGFTNPDADKAKMDALAYSAAADKLSWENTLKFLKEVFGS